METGAAKVIPNTEFVTFGGVLGCPSQLCDIHAVSCGVVKVCPGYANQIVP